MENLLGILDPQICVSTVSFFREQDRILGVQIKNQELDASASALEVHFSYVQYFSGLLTWPSADLWLEPSEISSQIAQQINPSPEIDGSQLGKENFHLYSFHNPKLPAQILARTFEILS